VTLEAKILCTCYEQKEEPKRLVTMESEPEAIRPALKNKPERPCDKNST
jgi:hypothetical protein